MSWKRPNVKERMSVFLSKLPKFGINTVIDVGTGDGIFAKLLQEKYPQSIVLSSDIRYYQAKFQDFLLHSVQAFPFRNSSVDVIMIAQVLHYIPYKDQVSVLQQLITSLSSGGILVIVEYNTARPNGWIPFPISQDMMREYNFPNTTIDFIYDNDRSRPKYACYFEKHPLLYD